MDSQWRTGGFGDGHWIFGGYGAVTLDPTGVTQNGLFDATENASFSGGWKELFGNHTEDRGLR